MGVVDELVQDKSSEDYDACICGDYRYQHENGNGECKVCGWMKHPEGGCHKFVLCQKANDTRNLPIR
jgi:uncharacterized membrane protein